MEPLWKLPAVVHYLLFHPPVGYGSIAKESALVAATETAAAGYDIAYKLHSLIGRVVPINLALLSYFYEQPSLLVGHEHQFESYKVYENDMVQLYKSTGDTP